MYAHQQTLGFNIIVVNAMLMPEKNRCKRIETVKQLHIGHLLKMFVFSGDLYIESILFK